MLKNISFEMFFLSYLAKGAKNLPNFAADKQVRDEI